MPPLPPAAHRDPAPDTGIHFAELQEMYPGLRPGVIHEAPRGHEALYGEGRGMVLHRSAGYLAVDSVFEDIVSGYYNDELTPEAHAGNVAGQRAGSVIAEKGLTNEAKAEARSSYQQGYEQGMAWFMADQQRKGVNALKDDDDEEGDEEDDSAPAGEKADFTLAA